MQRAAIKKQFFLDTFDFIAGSDVYSESTISVSLATSLADPLQASDQTARVWLEINSSIPLLSSQITSTTSEGTQVLEVCSSKLSDILCAPIYHRRTSFTVP